MEKNVWMIRAGEGGYLIDEFAKMKVVAIGWHLMGDLTNVKSQDAFKKLYRQAYPQAKPGRARGGVAVVHKFCNVVQIGDGVVSYDRNDREYLVGEIRGDYYYKPGIIEEYPNFRDVEWKSRVSRDDLEPATRNSLGSTLTLFAISPEAWDDIQSAIKGKTKRSPIEQRVPETDFDQLRQNRIDEAHESIKDKLLALDAYEMQDLVASILRAMGLKARTSPRGPDRGLDIFASPDGLGLQEPRVKVQVKHRKGNQSGPHDLRGFIGALRPGDRGLFVSTGGFSKEARYEAERANFPLELIDLDDLADLIELQYENFDSVGRGLLPLTKIYWPTE
jgi:restriction system protein